MLKQIERLIDALESGKFKKARGTLHNKTTGGFCCIGVDAVVNQGLDPKVFGVNRLDDGGPGKQSIYENFGNRYDFHIMDKLTNANDSTGGFSKSIEILKEYANEIAKRQKKKQPYKHKV